MMKPVGVLLAKSSSGQEIPVSARLTAHLFAVELAGTSIVAVAGPLILEQLGLPLDSWLSRLRRSVRVASLCHDIGKANDGFQRMVRGQLDPRLQPARHELLTALLLEDKNCFVRQWALEKLKESWDDGQQNHDDLEMLLNCVIGAVAGHHLKLDEQWSKAALALRGGCGTELKMMLGHPDLEAFFGDSIPQELCFSLVEGEPTFLGNRQLPFNLQSSRWHRKLAQESEWWRFAAAVKALVMAADVVGSAMLPEDEDIRKWVGTTLSGRVTAEEMKRVVRARLQGRPLRPFQQAIGQSEARVTLVEAGCGTGKTAAAYLWAARCGQGRKLFFCYPTTGTATEGFLGYVHETDVEATLMHSRAIVDLEGIARTPEDDDQDHLLRIESLAAWGPQVVVCTADMVLALVRNNRRGLYNSPAILSGAFIFDELHAYDNQMLAAVVAFIRALPGARFLLMTASLPRTRKEFLLRHISGLGEVPSPQDLQSVLRYQFLRARDEEDARKAATAAIADRKRVLWICNTVARAQATADHFGSTAKTYHSRFKYQHRIEKHREIIRAFTSDQCAGLLAATTQVAEMSLDLDADLLISEVAPIPALIQRLGRLNRRVTPEQPGQPRVALFISPEKVLPYTREELQIAGQWIDCLIALKRPLSQSDLAERFEALSPDEDLSLDMRTEWLDSGWWATPGLVREASCTVSVILPEDEKACRKSTAEMIKRAIPMTYNNRMQNWREFKGKLVAPPGAVDYTENRGAVLL